MRRAGSAPCTGRDRVDACLVGTRAQSGGDAVEWMRAQGRPIVSAMVSEQIVTCESDGSVLALPFGVEPVERFESRDGRRAEPLPGLSGGISGTVTMRTPRGSGGGCPGEDPDPEVEDGCGRLGR